MTNQIELAIEIVRMGDAGVRFLRKNLDPSDGCRYAATLRALAWVSKKSTHLPWVKRTLLGALGSGSSATEALHSLRLLRIRSAEKRAKQWLRRGNPYAAAAALKYLCTLYPKLRDEFLGTALRSEHYLVRGVAIDEIEEAGLVKYLPELRLLCQDRARDVREAARTAIANLTTA